MSEIFGVRDEEIDVEKIMEGIREIIRKRKSEVSRDFEPQVIRSEDSQQFLNIEIDAEMNSDITLANQRYNTADLPMVSRFGKIAAILKKLVNRSIRFYTIRQTELNAVIVRLLNRFIEKITNLNSYLKDVSIRISELEAETQKRHEELEKRLEEKAGAISREVSHQGSELSQRVEEVGGRLDSLDAEVQERVEALRIQGLDAQKRHEELEKRLEEKASELSRKFQTLKQNVILQERRLTMLLEEARKRLPEPISTEQIENMITEEDHLLDASYVSFEDEFRGTREDIKERLRVYLPYIQETNAGTEEYPILDLGCGRGEWLELLKENGFKGRGVDTNRVMFSTCRDLGFEAVEDDVLEFLRKQKPNSFGAITGFHIVEHLPTKHVVALFDEALRILKAGGIIILETPNPDNILVACRNFYMDPTHRNPLPSPMLQFLTEGRGFTNIQILNLHPVPDYDREENVTGELSRLLYGPQDYALIGYKA